MIQRIQSLYLLLASVAVGLVFFFPLAKLVVNEEFIFTFMYRGLYQVNADGVDLAVASMPLAALFTIILLINLITIFLYKKRGLQMRLCIINILLMLGSIGVVFYYISAAFSEYEAVVSYGISFIMPLIAAILTYMAYRGVRKDELLVISMDRIR
jgi:hypothetical protein